MHAVVYVSTEAMHFRDQDLLRLLEQSRSKNLGLDITGLLLYKDGNFMQLLEGPPDAVRSVMVQIKTDPRHKRVQVMMDEEVPRREFSNWSMGFRKLSETTVADVPAYSDFLNVPLTIEQFGHNPSRSLRFLRVFKETVA